MTRPESSDPHEPLPEQSAPGSALAQEPIPVQTAATPNTSADSPAGRTLLLAALGVLAMVGLAYWLRPTPLLASAPTQPTTTEALRELPAAVITLKAGEGQGLVQAYCTMCHSLAPIVNHTGFDAKTWEAEVNKMRQQYGAPIDDPTAQTIVKYLQANYATDMPGELGTAADMSPGTTIGN